MQYDKSMRESTLQCTLEYGTLQRSHNLTCHSHQDLYSSREQLTEPTVIVFFSSVAIRDLVLIESILILAYQ